MPRKLTKEEFIEKARKVHGDKYDYSKVEYKTSHIKVCIICPIHGEFWQKPNNHLQGQGCSKCGTEKTKNKERQTKEEFIKRAKEVHGDKYDYSKVKYINTKTKVCIICPVHGEFWQTPNHHLRGRECPICIKERRRNKTSITTEEFIQKAKKVHGDKYDYSKVEYKDAHTKVCIICPIHGEFWQRPNGHLNGKGCKECRKTLMHNLLSSNTEEFIEKARKTHGDKYDYSKVDYKNNRTKVCIICHEHGEFWQTPMKHLSGQCCPKCQSNARKGFEGFLINARRVHGDKYDYSKVNYKSAKEKICIICPIHGEFWQTPYKHVNCSHGCPKCNASRLEEEMRLFLQEKKKEFEFQKKFEWLGRQSLDFYLPQHNCAIECQGEQHFMTIEHFGGVEKFKNTKELDQRKKQLCEEHGVKLLYYSNLTIEYPYKVFEDKEKLLEEIVKK